MRRKKDDKRVLRPGNGSSSPRGGRKNTRFKSKNNRFKSNRNRSSPPHMKQKKKRKNNGKLVLVMIIALIAFIIGAAAGISLSFDDGSVDENTTQYENVTDQMVTNVTDSGPVVYNSSDSADSNQNQSSSISNHSRNSN